MRQVGQLPRIKDDVDIATPFCLVGKLRLWDRRKGVNLNFHDNREEVTDKNLMTSLRNK